ncbi:MAG: sodium-dependent transporter [Ruminococcus sp.]|nr:sodium-dependent transporter [Ruminococcus sp.]
MEETKTKRNSFSSSLGFILAAAGSAVGLGNIWRFPYLAAKDGGGVFLVIYIILALTFGFTLIFTEVALGRKTKQSCLTAYGVVDKRFGWIGGFASLVPFLILPYYSVIGGWVMKYMMAYIAPFMSSSTPADKGYFGTFITSYAQPLIFCALFLLCTIIIIYKGVNSGIERISRVLMPALVIAVIGIAIFSLTIKGSSGTGIDGLKTFIIPDFSGMSVKDVFMVVLDAMGQLFYSISVAMGIMVTYGSYFKDDSNLIKSVNSIELFDTLIAFLAGVMIIPPVVAFMGADTMKSTAGPSLMFVALPRVFEEMGFVGKIVGALFFVMVFFAALTSCISILEAVVSGLIDKFGWSRKKAVLIEGAVAMVIAAVVCLGYNLFYFETRLPNTSPDGSAQILDIFDYISNNILMPVVAIGTCILIGWIAKPKTIIEEATKNGEKFGRKALYVVMIKFIAPVLLFVLLLGSFGLFS